MSRKTSLLIPLALAFAYGCAPPDTDEDGTPDAADCAAEDASIHADAEEVCDGIDNNCDGVVDEGVTTTFYADADGDGHGGTLTIEACEAPAGFTAESTDCDDLDPLASPDGLEVCDDIDNDCDGAVDGDDDSVDASTGGTYYLDADGDGYGDPQQTVEACGTPDGYADNGEDCNDTDADVNPETVWYADIDGDGYGAADFTETGCTQPDGYTADATDCDDLDGAVNPAALEICDLVDNDCDGLTDDDDDSVDVTGYATYYADGDSDGYGLDDDTVVQCNAPSGYADAGGDCDDAESAVNPGEAEICEDGLDNDCSGDAPECGLGDGTTYDAADADFTITGDASYDYLGRSIADLDLDGDGLDDLVLGAYGNDDAGSTAGKISIFYGVTSSGTASDGDAVITGDSSTHYAGYALANAGDVNGDGYEDLLGGGYLANSYYGEAWVFYGSATGLVDGDTNDADVTLEGTGYYDYFGQGVAGLGDVNDDGFDDFAVGAYSEDNNGSSAGQIYTYYGSASSLSGGSDVHDASITGTTSYGYLGYYTSFDGLGDVDGDGVSDWAAGEYYYANSYYGAVYLYHGSTSSWSGDSGAALNADAEFTGSGTFDYFGRTVTGGDVTGDGYDDILTWEYYGGSDAGAVYIWAGSTTSWSGDYSANSDETYQWTGNTTYDYFGRSMDVGDVNGDGNDDLIVGAGGEDTGGSTAGAAYVIYGPITADGDATTANVAIYGDSSSEGLGYYGVGAADADGDGIDDVIGGAYNAGSGAGEALIFLGGSE